MNQIIKILTRMKMRISKMEKNITKIKFNNLDNIDKDFSKIFDNSKSYENEEALMVLNTLKVYDKSVQLKNENTLDFSNENVNFELEFNGKKYNLDVKLGEGNFENGVEHLINVGTNTLDKNKNDLEKENINAVLNKRFDFEFVLDNSLDKIKNITQKSLDNIGHIAGDDSKDFINGFNRVFQGITKSDLTKENTLDKNLSSDYKDKFLEFKKKHNMSKGQEKEISKKRTFGLEK